MVRIKEWSFRTNADGYMAPEAVKYQLCGKVYDHPKHSNGTEIVSTSIQNIDYVNRMVETRNNTYFLDGPPAQEWQTWMEENGKQDYLRRLGV